MGVSARQDRRRHRRKLNVPSRRYAALQRIIATTLFPPITEFPQETLSRKSYSEDELSSVKTQRMKPALRRPPSPYSSKLSAHHCVVAANTNPSANRAYSRKNHLARDPELRGLIRVPENHSHKQMYEQAKGNSPAVATAQS